MYQHIVLDKGPVTTTIRTAVCMGCGEASVISVPTKNYDAWQSGGKFIQDAFPGLNADQRELLLSGTHGPCWEMMFPPEPDLDEPED